MEGIRDEDLDAPQGNSNSSSNEGAADPSDTMETS
jgi:hypothetical protein